jgi:signal transduction histidine kinase
MNTDQTPEPGEFGEMLNRVRAILDDLRASVSPEQTAQLDEIVALLDEATTDISDFIQIVAFDLKAPATSTAGYADMMLKYPDDFVDKQERFLEVIWENARRQVEYLNAVSGAAWLKLGRMRLNYCEITLQKVVNDIPKEFTEAVEARGHELVLDIPDNLPTLWSDPWRAKQVISELIDNACRYTPDGGAITVKAEAVPGGVRVAVSDTGIGISPDALPRIFELFYRADHPMVREQKNHGLGLYIAHGLVRLLGSELSVESVPDEGSTFSFTLPAAKDREET